MTNLRLFEELRNQASPKRARHKYYTNRWNILIVAVGRGGSAHRNHRLWRVAALLHPLQAFGAQAQEVRGFVIEPFALVAVPQRFLHDPPTDLWAEIVFVVEARNARHHVRLGEMREFDVRQLV